MAPIESNDFKEAEDIARRFKKAVDENKYIFLDSEDVQTVVDYYMNIDPDNIAYASKAIVYGLKNFPDDPYLRLCRFRLFLYYDNIEEAEKELKYVAAHCELVPEFYMEKARLARIRHEEDKTIPLLKKSLAMDDANSEAHFMLAQEYVLKGNKDEAVAHTVKAIEVDKLTEDELKEIIPNLWGQIYGDLNPLYYDAFVGYFKDMTEIMPLASCFWESLGRTYLMNGDFCQEDFAKALEAFQFQQSLDEDNTLVISDIADAYFGMKEFREAIRCYELADKTNPDLHFDYDLGRCYLNLKEYSTALHYFLTALHQDTGPIIPVLIIENVVYILKTLDKYDDARAFLRKCLVNFKDGAPVVLRELITLLNPKTDLDELHELCLKAIALSLETDNDLYPFFSFMVSYCYDEDCPDLGLDMCNVYSDHVSLLHSIHYFQSLLYLKKGQFAEAFSHLELALSFDNTRLGIDFLDMDDDLRNIPEVLRLMQQYDADKYNNLH